MKINRKAFLKKVCISGTCMCGFSSIALSENQNMNPESSGETQDNNQMLIHEWISNLLANLNREMDNERIMNILKNCSIVHYNNLKMDTILSPYIGDLDKFICFLEEKWGWIIDYNKTTKTLIADENKNYCVCPIINKKEGINTSAICYCSEGFAEKMFSTVSGVSASAKVIASIRKGDDRCKYKIVFS